MKSIVERVDVTAAWTKAAARRRVEWRFERAPEREIPSDDLTHVAAATYAFEQPNGPAFYEVDVRDARGRIVERFSGKTFSDDLTWDGSRLVLIEAEMIGGRVRYQGLDWSAKGGARAAGRRDPRPHETRTDALAAERILPIGIGSLCWRWADSYLAGKPTRLHAIEWPSREEVPGADAARLFPSIDEWRVVCTVDDGRVLVLERRERDGVAAIAFRGPAPR